MLERAGLHSGVSEFYVKKGGKLTYTMIHAWDEQTHVRPRTGVIVEEGGEFISHYVNMTSVASLQTNPTVKLVGEGARAYLSSIITSKSRSVMDVGGTIHLEAQNTTGEIISRSIAKDKADVIARGTIISSARRTRGHVECMGLLLSNESRIRAIPVLDARNKDVRLTHEAAVGKLEEEQIFYLISRGFSKDEAISTLVRGFMKVELKGIPDQLKKSIDAAVEMAASGL